MRELIAQAEAIQHASHCKYPDGADDCPRCIADAQAEQPASDWLHLKPFGYAPGNYMNKCQACKEVVCGIDKRAITCRPCAEKAFAQAEQPAEPWEWICPGTRCGVDVRHSNHTKQCGNTLEVAVPDPRIAALEIELLTAIARMRTAIHMLDAGNTKGQVRLWLDGYCNTAPTEK